MLVQQDGVAADAKHIVSCCKKVSGEITARHDIVVNILLNNIHIQRGLITHEQRWEDRKTVRTARDEITVGTKYLLSEEWSDRGPVAGAKLMPDLVWLRRDSGDIWRMVVVDVKVTSTDKRNEVFKGEGRQVQRMGYERDQGDESGEGCDGAPLRLPRQSGPPRHCEKME